MVMYMVKSNYFTQPHTGKKYTVNNVITCSTYSTCILYDPMSLAYVGKTSRSLKQRIREHKGSIRRSDRDQPIAVHFNDFKHDISSFRFQGTEKVTLPERGGNVDEIPNRGEVYWTFNLQTLSPKGLNHEIPWQVMLYGALRSNKPIHGALKIQILHIITQL